MFNLVRVLVAYWVLDEVDGLDALVRREEVVPLNGETGYDREAAKGSQLTLRAIKRDLADPSCAGHFESEVSRTSHSPFPSIWKSVIVRRRTLYS